MSESYLYLAWMALETPLGIAVPCSDPQRLRTLLYRQREGYPELLDLEFRLSPVDPEQELWITRKGREAPQGKANAKETSPLRRDGASTRPAEQGDLGRTEGGVRDGLSVNGHQPDPAHHTPEEEDGQGTSKETEE